MTLSDAQFMFSFNFDEYAKAVHNSTTGWIFDIRRRNKCPRMKADDKSRRAYEDRQMLELYSSAERKLRSRADATRERRGTETSRR
ncbi:unnamed protein product, partial [Mesorhabditis belari]|uniref:Uncharacterized protein n=1 Tax=Mesorhabditis belari TaxID=2138241 RepID=A0AAF3JC20_9BILA